MSFWDTLLGRTKLPKPKGERLFAMATAQITLQASLGLRPTGRAGLCFRPVASGRFASAEEEAAALARIGGEATGTQVETRDDAHGFRWLVFSDPDFEDLVAHVHAASRALIEAGFGEQLLAAVFPFVDESGQSVFWVFSYRRAAFYPFVPAGGRQRDNAYELRLQATMRRELPLEAELERWYALWDPPL
ncbi:MAG: hypothetical protein HY691_05365 [Chloroflexi bacterium]|nr:hypothetical protein [Chloroflexota bacterium]